MTSPKRRRCSASNSGVICARNDTSWILSLQRRPMRIAGTIVCPKKSNQPAQFLCSGMHRTCKVRDFRYWRFSGLRPCPRRFRNAPHNALRTGRNQSAHVPCRTVGEAVSCPTGKSPIWLSSASRKIFLFSPDPTQIYNFRHPVPQEGRIAIVTDVGCGMRWTRRRQAREVRAGRKRRTRTAKSCGPDTPTLVSSWRSNPSMTVAKEPGHRGEREGNR
jgi:hypothetical protein